MQPPCFDVCIEFFILFPVWQKVIYMIHTNYVAAIRNSTEGNSDQECNQRKKHKPLWRARVIKPNIAMEADHAYINFGYWSLPTDCQLEGLLGTPCLHGGISTVTVRPQWTAELYTVAGVKLGWLGSTGPCNHDEGFQVPAPTQWQ